MKTLHKVLAVMLFGAMVAPVQSAAIAGNRGAKKQQGGYKRAPGKRTEPKKDKKS